MRYNLVYSLSSIDIAFALAPATNEIQSSIQLQPIKYIDIAFALAYQVSDIAFASAFERPDTAVVFPI